MVCLLSRHVPAGKPGREEFNMNRNVSRYSRNSRRNKRKRTLTLTVTLVILFLLIAGVLIAVHFLSGRAGGGAAQETTAATEAETTRPTEEETTVPPETEAPSTAPAEQLSGETVSFDKAELNEWYLKVASPAYPVDQSFVPETGLIKSANGTTYKVDKRILEPLKEMIAAAKKDGVTLSIISAYRSFDYQTGLFDKKVKEQETNGYKGEEAKSVAATIVARPGTSEHQLGLALDFNYLSEKYANSKELTWLREHGPDYGFILRYEKGKEEITGVIYEPWHFRYVTPKHAKEITRRGITLDEYVKLFH